MQSDQYGNMQIQGKSTWRHLAHPMQYSQTRGNPIWQQLAQCMHSSPRLLHHNRIPTIMDNTNSQGKNTGEYRGDSFTMCSNLN
jgi:hypothetical protein